jgi:hypothetical protein
MLDYQSVMMPVPQYTNRKIEAWNFTSKSISELGKLPIRILDVPARVFAMLSSFFALPSSVHPSAWLECKNMMDDIFNESKHIFKKCNTVYIENPILALHMSWYHDEIRIYAGFDVPRGKFVIEIF